MSKFSNKVRTEAHAKNLATLHGEEAAKQQHLEIVQGVWGDFDEESLALDWFEHAAESAKASGIPTRWRSVYSDEYDRVARVAATAYWHQRNRPSTEDR